MSSGYPLVNLPPLIRLNLKDDKYRLGSGDVIQADNVFINEDGSIDRVDGITNILNSALSSICLLSLIEWERWDGTLELLFLDGTTLRRYNNDGTSTIIKSGLTDSAKIRYVSYNDALYMGNGLDTNKVHYPTHRHKIGRTAITTANATDLATVKTLANALKADMNLHLASTTQHNAADTTNTIGFTDLVGGDSQATTNTAVNELKTDYNAHRSQSGVHPETDSYHLVEAANATDLATSITLVNEIKLCYNQHIQDEKIMLWTFPAPSGACTAAITTGTALEVGAYKYVYTYYNPINGVRTPPSTAVSITTTTGNEAVNLTVIAPSTDPQGIQIEIWRTVVAGSTYYKVATITNVNTTYADTTPDASLGTALDTEGLTTVPNTNIFLLYNDYVYMAGDYANPFRLYFTNPLQPQYYDPTTNFFDFDVAITGLMKLPNGILVFERYKTWFLAGTIPWTFAPKILLSPVVGVRCQEALCYLAEGVVGGISEYGIFATDSTTINMLSDEINSELLTKNLESAVLTYDSFNRRLYAIVAEN